MENDTFHRDFMVRLIWTLSGNLIYHIFSIKTPDKLGRCNQQVASLQVNRLPSWIPQVGYYEPDPSHARN